MVLPVLPMRWTAAVPVDCTLVLLAIFVGALVTGRVGAGSSGLSVEVGGGEDFEDGWGGSSAAAHRITNTPGTYRSRLRGLQQYYHINYMYDTTPEVKTAELFYA